ncbi:MAG: sulfur carrier protein ThiS [Blastocatellia bacterium]
MQIVLNGENKEISENISLKQLVDKLELKQERVAIELNKTVARRKDWAEIMLKDGDQLEIVHFVGGG